VLIFSIIFNFVFVERSVKVMAKPQEQHNRNVDEHEGIDLRGTLVGVGIVGIVIIIMWFGVWGLFISRLNCIGRVEKYFMDMLKFEKIWIFFEFEYLLVFLFIVEVNDFLCCINQPILYVILC